MSSIDWFEIPERLYSLSVEAVRSFAGKHRREVFYGFAFDCNAYYGKVLLCLNTEKDFRRTSRDFPDESEEWLDRELRWELGDWKYQGLNTPEFDMGWEPYRDLIRESACHGSSDDKFSTLNLFMDSVCRVVLRMASSDDFSTLRRESYFRVFAADHDESVDAAWSRIERVRSDPIHPDVNQKNAAYTEKERQSSDVYFLVDRHRKKKVAHSPVKFMLKRSMTYPPRLMPDGWWLVYESENEGYSVLYNSQDDQYRAVLGESDITFPSIAEVARHLEDLCQES